MSDGSQCTAAADSRMASNKYGDVTPDEAAIAPDATTRDRAAQHDCRSDTQLAESLTVAEQGRHCSVVDRRFVSRKNAADEPLDDVERKFLEPVARYLAILQEWSLERPSDGTGTVPQCDQP